MTQEKVAKEDVKYMMDHILFKITETTDTSSSSGAEYDMNFHGKCILMNQFHFNELSVFTGLCYEDTFAALHCLGWIDDGKYVWVVLDVLADTGFISKAETVRFSKEKCHSKSFLSTKFSNFFSPVLNCGIKFYLFSL